MKSIKRSILVLGAVVIAMLMVSSATGVAMPQSNENSKSGAVVESCESRVDPDINITTDKLSTLYESLQYIDNPDVLSLVQAIIDEIEKDGLATSEDIQQIEEDLGIFFPIHAGRINSNGDGYVSPFPGILLMSFFCLRWGPSVVVHWSGNVCQEHTSYTAKTYINTILRYQGNHEGFIIGYLGYCSFGPFGNGGWPVYNVFGTSVLIVVIPGEGCISTTSLQSNPAPQTQPSTQPSSEPISKTTTQTTIDSTTLLGKTASK